MRYLTVPEVAAVLGMGEEYVQRQCRLGHLRGKKLGTTWRIAEDDVALFMTGDRVAPPARAPRTARQRRRSA